MKKVKYSKILVLIIYKKNIYFMKNVILYSVKNDFDYIELSICRLHMCFLIDKLRIWM